MNDLTSLFSPADPSLLVTASYAPWLVLLSLAVAVFASWVALQMADQASQAPSRALRLTALGTGSVALGAGVWAMHFVGMLAFTLCTPVAYEPGLTVVSMLPSVAASSVALWLLARPRVAQWQLVVGAVLVGLGIGSMHYAGMGALRMALVLRYDLGMFLLSIVVAVGLAWVALRVRFGLASLGLSHGARVLAAAVVMGLAIAGMHYTGMAAARFVGPVPMGAEGQAANAGFMAATVCAITIALALAALALNGWLRYRDSLRRAQAHEARQKALLAASVDGVITLNTRGEVEDFNAAAERLFGYARAEVLGWELGRLLVEEAGEPGEGVAAASNEPAVLVSEEAGIVSKSRDMLAMNRLGVRVPVRASFGFRRQVEGDLFIVFVSDESEHKAVQSALRQSESQLRSLMGSIPGAAYRVRVEAGWPIVYVNESIERLTGYPASDFTGPDAPRRLLDLMLPEDRDINFTELGQAVRDGRAHLLEFRLMRADGQVRWMWSNGRASCDARGRPVWLDGVIFDITERKEAELAMQRFQSLVESSGDAIFTTTLDGVVMSWNRGAELTFGYTAQEAMGRRCEDLIADPTASGQPKLLLSRVVAGEQVQQIEAQRRRKDGTSIGVSLTISPIFDTFGKMVGASAIARDITERRRMEADLRAAKEVAEKAAEARTAFLANMSHEIRTPMNAVLGFTDVLLQGELYPEQRRHLNTIRGAGRSLLRLLNEVLDIAKLDRGAMELEPADFNLLSLIDALTSTLGHQAQAKGLLMQVQYAPGLPAMFHGDELRVRQVLINLLGNALKFTAAGSVTLSVARNEEGPPGLHFIVRDTGIGIAPERLAMIFDAFTQADASMSRRYGGTGLGTTIAKQLTELMGGQIWAESVVGEGSAFHVVLPLHEVRGVAPVQHTEQALPALRPLRILAADDVPQNLELLQLLLEGLGHRVWTASDGIQAAGCTARESFDLVLMDVHMPGMDGLEATRRIRAAEALSGRARVPVVALTASVQSTDLVAAREAGMDGFAAKPVELPALLAEIARVLDRAGKTEQVPGAAAVAAEPEAIADGRAINTAHRVIETARLQASLLAQALSKQDVADQAPEARAAEEEPALDYAGGLRRCGGRASSYLRLLGRFAEHYSNSAQAIITLAEAGDYKGGREAAHKMRGVAANLGLEALRKLSTALEENLAHAATTAQGTPGAQAHALTPLLQVLPARMQEALAAIAQAREAAEQATADSTQQVAAPAAQAEAGRSRQEALTAKAITAAANADAQGEANAPLRTGAAEANANNTGKDAGATSGAASGPTSAPSAHQSIDGVFPGTALTNSASAANPADPSSKTWALLSPAAQRIVEAALAHLTEDARADADTARKREGGFETHAANPSRTQRNAASVHYGARQGPASPIPPLANPSANPSASPSANSSANPSANPLANPSANTVNGAAATSATTPASGTTNPPAERSRAPVIAGATPPAVPTPVRDTGPATLEPARPSKPAPGPLSPQAIEELRALVATLARSFERGALDDRALARLLVVTEARGSAPSRAALQRAVDDFDFALARSRLATLLVECTGGGNKS